MIYSILPISPQPPFDLYFLERNPFQNSSHEIFICKLTSELFSYPYYISRNNDCNKVIQGTIYGGVKNLLNANLCGLSGYGISFVSEKWMTHTFFKGIERKLKESGITSCKVYFCDGGDFSSLLGTKVYSLEDIIKNPGNYGITCTDTKQGISDGGSPIPGADRKRVMLLEPVIESSTITWLFSKEK